MGHILWVLTPLLDFLEKKGVVLDPNKQTIYHILVVVKKVLLLQKKGLNQLFSLLIQDIDVLLLLVLHRVLPPQEVVGPVSQRGESPSELVAGHHGAGSVPLGGELVDVHGVYDVLVLELLCSVDEVSEV